MTTVFVEPIERKFLSTGRTEPEATEPKFILDDRRNLPRLAFYPVSPFALVFPITLGMSARVLTSLCVQPVAILFAIVAVVMVLAKTL